MRPSLLLCVACSLVCVWATGCGRDDTVRRVVETDATGDDATGEGGSGDGGFGETGGPTGDDTSDAGTDATSDTASTGATGDTDTTSTGATDDTGPIDTGTEDSGTGTGDIPADPSGIYQGTHHTDVTTADGTEIFTGKLAVKIRIDGVFSGTGTGANEQGNAAELSITGQVTQGAITGKVTWKWPSAGGQAPPPVVMDATGTLSSTTLTVSFLGGSPAQKFQGTLTLEKTGS